MHGFNDKRKFVQHAPDGLQVHTLFHTVQGEGPFAGEPCVFVRLTGCNLACWFCDTVWEDDSDPTVAEDNLIQQVLDAPGDAAQPELVVLTGGEPTRQSIDWFVSSLVGMGKRVQIETAGSFWRGCMDLDGVTVVVSPCLLYTSPSPRDRTRSRMPSSA